MYESSGSIAVKFYLKHHWDGGKAALGFEPDRTGTLVSMATDTSHRVIMGETTSSCLIGSFSFLQLTPYDIHKSLDEFDIWQDSTMDYGVSCP